MFSTINSLQKAIVEKLRSDEVLSRFRIVKEECLRTNNINIVGNTTSIVVKIPFPLSASSAFSNFNFSQIAISIEINTPRHNTSNTHSPISLAEHISKKLHSWQANTDVGQCTICINPQNPWQEYVIDEQVFSLSLNFISQSIA